ncbi:hypothetical protein BMS_1050 [Halobacteriovorax marinus SJ]|uniref:Uncharacterized protein n=1 Tax=Halobacteriovorax marinus (strain ATCC BAA-682 / DSM 15412 / SJ) TaxID=862908 RepID=E1WXX7_HALMS|nr:hypothetical protein [Halobacteriovorax marinus]CBW25934.1 hypothetical protein BMS_1050 [Halobacteriovorax marinus SJ]
MGKMALAMISVVAELEVSITEERLAVTGDVVGLQLRSYFLIGLSPLQKSRNID